MTYNPQFVCRSVLILWEECVSRLASDPRPEVATSQSTYYSLVSCYIALRTCALPRLVRIYNPNIIGSEKSLPFVPEQNTTTI